jgi:hypothetical protein
MKHSMVCSRRPRSNAAERAQWVQQFSRSGLSQREFAARHRLRLSTLQRWVKQNVQRPAPPAFTELKFPPLSPRWAAEVVRPDGSVLRLAHDAPATLLQHLLPCRAQAQRRRTC